MFAAIICKKLNIRNDDVVVLYETFAVVDAAYRTSGFLKLGIKHVEPIARVSVYADRMLVIHCTAARIN
jgi:hypothetical protein